MGDRAGEVGHDLMPGQPMNGSPAIAGEVLSPGRSRWCAHRSAAYAIQLLVPIYNEGENVVVLYQRLAEDGVDYDSLKFIYDFPEDTSLPFIEQLAAADPRVSSDMNRYGRGVLNALRWGFSGCTSGPVIVLMGDNSDKLSVIPEMLARWSQGAAIVSPSRYMPGGAQHGGPPLKTFLSRNAGRFLRLVGFPTADATNNFKLYDGDWLKRQEIESVGGFEVALELCYKAYRDRQLIVELPTEWYDRTAGESRFKLWSWLPRYLKWYVKLLLKIAGDRVNGGYREAGKASHAAGRG